MAWDGGQFYQECLPSPPDGWIWLNVGAWWGRENAGVCGWWLREAQIFLFRAGWKHIFCIPGFEHVSSGGWVRLSDWVKETHCVVKAEWKCIFI